MNVKRARLAATRLVREMGIAAAPVDVVRIADRLGMQLVYGDLGNEVSGLLVTTNDRACICVHERHPVVRQRFTIAHEIGHYYLRHQFEPGEHVHVDHGTKVSARSSHSSVGLDRREVEANQFAATLLMPASLVRARAVSIGSISDIVVMKLAGEFNVSEQAMEYRLSTLKL